MPVLALLSLILLGPLAGGATGQRVVDTPELFGITSALVKGNALEVVKDDTLPPGLDLWFAGNRVTRASVKVGELRRGTSKSASSRREKKDLGRSVVIPAEAHSNRLAGFRHR